MSLEEIIDGVAWTPALRGEVIPSRQFPNVERRAKLLKATGGLVHPIDRAYCFRYLVAYSYERLRARAIAGLAKNPAHWRPVVEQAIENAAHPEARGPLDVDVEVAAATLELYPLWMALPFWIAEGGLVFALRALVRCHDVAPLCREMDGGDENYLLEVSGDGEGRPLIKGDRWELVRCMLADAIEPVYDEAHAIADRARLARGGDPELQLSIAFAFPDERAWAEDAAGAALVLAKQRRGMFTLASFMTVAPVKAAVKLVERTAATWMMADKIATVLAHHGASAAPILAKLLAASANDSVRTRYCEYMLAIRTAEARRALDVLAKRPRANRVFRRFAAAHRKLM